jgi:uncharacterized protein DUF6152
MVAMVAMVRSPFRLSEVYEILPQTADVVQPVWRTSLKNRIVTVWLGLAVLVSVTSLMAHHSPSAIFDMKNKITLKGSVTKVDWVNPHIVVYMDAKADDGSVEGWKFESNPPRWFTKVGVTRADFAQAIGQTVSVVIVKAVDGSKYGYLQQITFPNGNSLSLLEPGQTTEVRP